MKFAYADPPYPGQSKRYYRDHPDFAGEVDHARLIEEMESEFPDGWALSTGASMLQEVLSYCPTHESKSKRFAHGSGVRVAIWHVTNAMPPGPPSRWWWSWEAVIVRGGRWRQTEPTDFVRDLLACGNRSGALSNRIIGEKPDAFSTWVFNLLGATPGDELVDLFPGSGAVGDAWARFQAQPSLFEAS